MKDNEDMANEQYIESVESLSEFRIYVSSVGGVPVVKDIKGEVELKKELDRVIDEYPHARIFVREVNESVILVIGPGGQFLYRRE